MKKKTRILSLALSGLMLLPTPTMVLAADDPTSTVTTSAAVIDQNLTGSITLYKYLDNDGVSIDAEGIPYANLDTDGTSSQDMVWVIRDILGNDSIMPEKNSQFKLLKVADIEQVTENTNNGGLNVTGTYYTNLDPEFFAIMNSYLGANSLTASESTRVTDERTDAGAASEVDDHYESDELNEKILTVNRMPALADGSESVTGETALNRYVRQHQETTDNGAYCKEFALTDENGYTTLDNLPLGLYLVCETDWEHKALSKHDNYWEVVDDGIADAIDSAGLTEDAGTNAGGSTSAGVNAGGSTYADIASPVSPFLISIPMTNIADIKNADGTVKYTAGSAWQYDITVYPKAASINIHKDIVTNDFSTTDDGKGGTLTSNDGNDTVATESLCDFVQTNYDRLTTSLDGTEKTGLTHQIDANIGDTITQLISADVPVLVDDIDNEQTGANHETANRKHNAKYVITDRMTKGLKLIDTDSFVVTMGPGAWNDYVTNQILEKDVDYKITLNETLDKFVLEATEEGLAKMDDLKQASYYYVLYKCVLTKDALVGTDTYGNQRIVEKADATTETEVKDGIASDALVKDTSKTDTAYISTYSSGETDDGTVTVQHADATNQNTAQLTYATDRTMEHDYYSNTTKVFTYEVGMTKLFTDGTQGYVSKNDADASSFQYSDVTFTVRGSVSAGSEDAVGTTDGYEEILFWRDDEGRYHVYDPWTHSSSYDSQYNAAADTIDTPEENRQITKYISPSDTGLLTIIGLDSRTYEFTEVKTAQGRNLMAEPFYVEVVAPMVEREGKDGPEMVKLEDGSVEHAYVWTGSKPSDSEISGYDLANSTSDTQARLEAGRIPFVVQNNEVIKVLKTGGEGTTMLFVTGGLLILAAGILVGYSRKKEQEA